MSFNHKYYLDKFLADHARDLFTNNSPATVDKSPALAAFRIIGIHRLTPSENDGKQNLFIDIRDTDGKRLDKLIDWGWQGQRANEPSPALILDKPDSEPAGNLVIWGGQIIWATVMNQPSDTIRGVTTGLADVGPGATWGHHSYYCVWQWVEGGTTPPPIDPPAEDCTELQQRYNKLMATLAAIKELVK